MPQPELLKKKKERGADNVSVLYQKTPDMWVTTCPSCGIEYNVSYNVIAQNKQPTCCGWTWRLFDMTNNPPTFDPCWIR